MNVPKQFHLIMVMIANPNRYKKSATMVFIALLNLDLIIGFSCSHPTLRDKDEC